MTATSYETDHYQPSGYSAPAEEILDPDAAIDAEISGDQEADELEADLDSDENSADEASEGAGAGKGKAAAKPSRSLFRRVAAKTIEVQEATVTVRALAAAQVGGADDVVELVASIMSATRGSASPLTDIEAIQDGIVSEPWGVGITATSMGRVRLKAIWTLLHTMGIVGTPAPPASDAKAGLAVVKAVNDLTDDHKLELVASGELLKRS